MNRSFLDLTSGEIFESYDVLTWDCQSCDWIVEGTFSGINSFIFIENKDKYSQFGEQLSLVYTKLGKRLISLEDLK